jgi:hypothetical protein
MVVNKFQEVVEMIVAVLITLSLSQFLNLKAFAPPIVGTVQAMALLSAQAHINIHEYIQKPCDSHGFFYCTGRYLRIDKSKFPILASFEMKS